jgi:hypothetical protein
MDDHPEQQLPKPDGGQTETSAPKAADTSTDKNNVVSLDRFRKK